MWPTGNIVLRAGYTLVEILVVLSLLVLMMAAVPAVYKNISPGFATKSLVQDLRNGLINKRTEASLSGSTTAFLIGVGTNIASGSSVESGVEIPPAFEIEVINLFPTSTKDVSQIIFYSDGSSSGGSIILRRGDQNIRIDIDWLTSKISVQEIG